MCRIAGFIDFNFNGSYDFERTASQMRDSLACGGPDDAGSFFEKENGIALTHRRLSILDLSPLGHQPMEFMDLVISYNGEVYNFKEIRLELEKENYHFNSASDTEVILKAFHKWGPDCVHKFRGMWAFAVWNKKSRELFLCRDRMGVKPLYWYFNNNLFMFASELKAFHKHPKFYKKISEHGLSLFFQYGYISSPYSIFKHTYKLESGHFLVVKNNHEIIKKKYWDIEDYFPGKLDSEFNNRPDSEIENELEKILEDSFKLRMVSDVPVGVFLSGGIDSTCVASLLQKNNSSPLQTFTIGFQDEKYNEAEWAKKVAAHLRTNHTELYCTPTESFDVLHKLPEIYDEPLGDSSAIPTLLVSQLTRKNVKVSLSADGGDELFFGYTRYWHALSSAQVSSVNAIGLSSIVNNFNPVKYVDDFGNLKFPFSNNHTLWNKYTRKWLKMKGQEMFSWYDIYSKIFQEKELNMLGINHSSSQLMRFNFLKTFESPEIMMVYDLKTYLQEDLLAKVDRASMSVGLEGRDPFLDHKILEYAAQLSLHYKYRNGVGKYILKNIVYKYVPKELLERPKQGFTVPIHKWFKSEFGELAKQYLLGKKSEVLDSEHVEMLLKEYNDGKEKNYNKLYLLLMFRMWEERWIS